MPRGVSGRFLQCAPGHDGPAVRGFCAPDTPKAAARDTRTPTARTSTPKAAAGPLRGVRFTMAAGRPPRGRRRSGSSPVLRPGGGCSLRYAESVSLRPAYATILVPTALPLRCRVPALPAGVRRVWVVAGGRLLASTRAGHSASFGLNVPPRSGAAEQPDSPLRGRCAIRFFLGGLALACRSHRRSRRRPPRVMGVVWSLPAFLRRQGPHNVWGPEILIPSGAASRRTDCVVQHLGAP